MSVKPKPLALLGALTACTIFPAPQARTLPSVTNRGSLRHEIMQLPKHGETLIRANNAPEAMDKLLQEQRQKGKYNEVTAEDEPALYAVVDRLWKEIPKKIFGLHIVPPKPVLLLTDASSFASYRGLQNYHSSEKSYSNRGNGAVILLNPEAYEQLKSKPAQLSAVIGHEIGHSIAQYNPHLIYGYRAPAEERLRQRQDGTETESLFIKRRSETFADMCAVSLCGTDSGLRDFFDNRIQHAKAIFLEVFKSEMELFKIRNLREPTAREKAEIKERLGTEHPELEMKPSDVHPSLRYRRDSTRELLQQAKTQEEALQRGEDWLTTRRLNDIMRAKGFHRIKTDQITPEAKSKLEAFERTQHQTLPLYYRQDAGWLMDEEERKMIWQPVQLQFLADKPYVVVDGNALRWKEEDVERFISRKMRRDIEVEIKKFKLLRPGAPGISNEDLAQLKKNIGVEARVDIVTRVDGTSIPTIEVGRYKEGGYFIVLQEEQMKDLSPAAQKAAILFGLMEIKHGHVDNKKMAEAYNDPEKRKQQIAMADGSVIKYADKSAMEEWLNMEYIPILVVENKLLHRDALELMRKVKGVPSLNERLSAIELYVKPHAKPALFQERVEGSRKQNPPMR